MIDTIILLTAAYADRFGGPQIYEPKKDEKAACYRLWENGMFGRSPGMPVGHYYVTDDGHDVAAELSAQLYVLAEGISK